MITFFILNIYIESPKTVGSKYKIITAYIIFYFKYNKFNTLLISIILCQQKITIQSLRQFIFRGR